MKCSVRGAVHAAGAVREVRGHGGQRGGEDDDGNQQALRHPGREAAQEDP